MFWWDRLAEDKIKSAIDEGAFERLPGYGRKLVNDHDASNDQWVANHILETNQLLPEWLQLRKDVHGARGAVAEALHEYEEADLRLDRSLPGDRAILNRLEERYVERAREINRSIDQHNVRCPSIFLELPRFQEDVISRRRQLAH
ncbi:MAG TPA: DUF1992 domain-containing protein [Nitrolancea sp.]